MFQYNFWDDIYTNWGTNSFTIRHLEWGMHIPIQNVDDITWKFLTRYFLFREAFWSFLRKCWIKTVIPWMPYFREEFRLPFPDRWPCLDTSGNFFNTHVYLWKSFSFPFLTRCWGKYFIDWHPKLAYRRHVNHLRWKKLFPSNSFSRNFSPMIIGLNGRIFTPDPMASWWRPPKWLTHKQPYVQFLCTLSYFGCL